MTAQKILVDGPEKLLYFSDQFSFLSIEELTASIPWRQNEIRIFGKTHPEPRLTAWCGPAYQYSNIRWEETPWIKELDSIRKTLIGITGFEFNAVLCNLYRDGNDSMGWHSDDEKEIDSHLIASISLGAPRNFNFRNKKDRKSGSIELEHGSLLLMEEFQENWHHSVPKSKKVVNPRMNLTFRRIVAKK
jgi:alkylated DNA repair dioxygenase AlkB